MGQRRRSCFSWGLGAIAATIAIVSFLAPRSSEAYTVRTSSFGDSLHWEAERIVFVLDDSLAALGDAEVVEEALVAAMAEWQESRLLPVQLAISTGNGASAGYEGRGENENSVVASFGPWPYESQWSAVTLVTHDSASGQIIDADIVFDASRPWSTGDSPSRGSLDLQDVATHELGHALGLEHSDVIAATMYAEGGASTDRRTLHADDLAGLAAVYGMAESLGREHVGCSASPGPAPKGAMPAVLVLGWLVAFRLTRRK